MEKSPTLLSPFLEWTHKWLYVLSRMVGNVWKRMALLFILVILCSAVAYGQEMVNGTVTDAQTGDPLVGVNILVKGTTTGGVTNADGHYSLKVPSLQDSLRFSYIGYQTATVGINGRTTINIELESTVVSGKQLVVVGFGTQEKRKITTAVSQINTTNVMKDGAITNTGQLLQGRIPGVQVRMNNGAPGSTPTIQIHGISSINAGTAPLVVINGFPVGNGIPQSLNPNNIENITVLKDAASTSIYGARGSNGVILIQTKQAKKSQSEIDYNVSGGIQYVPKGWRPNVLNALQYAQYNKERVEDLNAHNNTNNPVPKIFTDVLNNPNKFGKGTNWLDAFLREGTNAFIQKHNLTFRKGNENLHGVISAGYSNQEGVVPNSGFKRYSLTTNVQGEVTDWLKAEGRLALAYTNQDIVPNTSAGVGGLIINAVTASPLKTPYDSDGNLIHYLPADAPGYFGFTNPIYRAKAIKDKEIGKNIRAGLNLDIKIINGLHYKPKLYVRLHNNKKSMFTPTTIGKMKAGNKTNLAPGAPPFVNSAIDQIYNITNWGMDNLLTYKKDIGGHSLKILAGYTAQKQTGELSQINATNFSADNHINYLEASEIKANISDYTNWSLAAFFGRINYDYKGRYLIELNYRREGSSKFGKDNKYGNFPSASIGWNISRENFFPERALINNLKIRGSYGITGNSAIGKYDRLGEVVSIPNINNIENNYNYVLNNKIITGKALTEIGNPNLQWETSRQLDIGLTLGLLKSQITIKVDYYRKKTKNMLFNVPLPGAAGFSSMRVNAGKMLNSGWDFGVNTSLSNKNFSWSSNLNISLLRNKVTALPSQINKIIETTKNMFNITKVGAPVGSLYGYRTEGLFETQKQLENPNLFGWKPSAKAPGAFIFKDINGDGKIDAQDRTIIGKPHPNLTFGFANGFEYKGLSLSVLLTGAFGYQIGSRRLGWLYNEKGRWNVSTKFLHRWRSFDDPGNGIIPAIFYSGQHAFNNVLVESGNHVWVKNISFGYAIPSHLFNQFKYLSNIRLYFTIHNAFRITNYSGWNPEVSAHPDNPLAMGLDLFSYPIPRTFTIGANIKF